MKFALPLFFILLIFTGCQKEEVQAPLKDYHNFDNFDYSVDSVAFYEKEFKTILAIDNPKILKEYYKFYDKNASYFINGKQKASKLLNKYLNLRSKKNVKSVKDIKKYKELAKQNNIQALRKLVEHYKIDNPELSLEYLKKLVSLKDIKSMKDYASANIYMNRPVIVQDIKEAVKTYEELGELGEFSSLMRLGNIYEYGYHKSVIKKDLEKSLEYYEQASKKGYAPALKKLYKIYSCQKCEGDRYNPEKAQEIEKLLSKLTIKPIKTKIKKPKLISKVETKKRENKKIVAKKIEPKKIEIEQIKPKQAVAKEAIAKDKVKKVALKKSQNQKPAFLVKCYDMKTAQAKLSKECEKRLEKIVQDKNINSILIIPVLDKKDYAQLKNNKSLEKTLSKERAEKVSLYLKENTNETLLINNASYHVTSKKSNRGVVIRVFK